jgi:hypothetical protein
LQTIDKINTIDLVTQKLGLEPIRSDFDPLLRNTIQHSTWTVGSLWDSGWR